MIAIGKYIIVTPVVEELKTSSGMLLTDETTLRYKRAFVVEPGTLVDSVNSGDQIYYDKNAGHSIMINDEIYLIILERDVVVVL
jgi:co-chaperonin GroES (HSP10)